MTTDTSSATPSEPVSISTQEELESLISTHDVVLVDFYADWCGPCQMMEPAIESISEETSAAVVKVDVDRFQQLAADYGVQGVPTLYLFVDGEPVDRMVGMQTGDTLETAIASQAN